MRGTPWRIRKQRFDERAVHDPFPPFASVVKYIPAFNGSWTVMTHEYAMKLESLWLLK
jgi:hypothetical protein